MLDEGTFTISVGTAIVGREEFTIRAGRSSGPGGYTISSTATFPPASPRVTLAPVVELGPDSIPLRAQFDVYGDGQRRVYLQFNARRTTLRIVRPGGESARELPAPGPQLLVSDSTPALYALLPLRPQPLRALEARTGQATSAQIVDRGQERTTIQGVTHQLRHVILRLGEGERHLWYDARGRLMRVDVPASGLVAERLPGAP